jgi:succinate dehydrogenase/fumarate reductase-like Fe-S protein
MTEKSDIKIINEEKDKFGFTILKTYEINNKKNSMVFYKLEDIKNFKKNLINFNYPLLTNVDTSKTKLTVKI